jgi:hypothetical protein
MVRTYQTHTGTNGVTTKTKTVAFSLFDSKNSIGKLRTTNTEKTQSMGIADLEQESSSTGTVALASGIAEGVAKGMVKGMK